MENNKPNPIVIVLLVIAVALLAYIAFGKDNNEQKQIQEVNSQNQGNSTGQNNQANNLASFVKKSTKTGKTISFNYSNSLTPYNARPEEDSSFIMFLDGNDNIRFYVIEIPVNALAQQRALFSELENGTSSSSTTYLGAKNYGSYTVKQFQNGPKQIIAWIDFGDYGLTITDDSEGGSMIDYSSILVK
jgi:hypothetical protein